MPSPERFVTLFDYNFLPQGLALAESLAAVCPDAELWVLCMDEALERALARLAPPGLRPIPLREVEDSRLLAAKADRSAREYCWTATAFTFDAVFERCPDARRVTYLDADLFFFDSPRPIFGEFERSGAAVLVTEHGYDPVYDLSGIVGRFCVQFLTMDRSARAAAARRWWQDRVLEWCYDRREPGRFGDQKYLDSWPELFGDAVHVLSRRELALAPWNARMESARAGGDPRPVFYHFHSFRIVAPRRARTVEGGYAIPRPVWRLYREYLEALGRAAAAIEAGGAALPCLPHRKRRFSALRHVAKLILGRADGYAAIRRPR